MIIYRSGPKRFPQSAEFDVNNDVHMDYVISMANLLAVNFGLQPANKPLADDHAWRSREHVAKIIGTLKVPAVVLEKVDLSDDDGSSPPKKTPDIELETDTTVVEEEEVGETFEESIAEFKNILEEVNMLAEHARDAKVHVEPADFEKDADWNFHIDFITATSNMRAWNYGLKEVSRHKCKMIAGRIIPALATTTAAVTGLAMIELVKLIQPGKTLEAFKNSSNSLGVNGYFFHEPVPPEKEEDGFDVILYSEIVCKPAGFTKWDQTLIKGDDLTLKEFLDAFKDRVGLNCITLFHANAESEDMTKPGHGRHIYERNPWKKENIEKYNDLMSVSLKDITEDLYGEDAVSGKRTYIFLEVTCKDDDGNAFKIPQVVYHFA